MCEELIPGILYAEGSEKVNKKVVEDLKVPDPDDDVAIAALQSHVIDTMYLSKE